MQGIFLPDTVTVLFLTIAPSAPLTIAAVSDPVSGFFSGSVVVVPLLPVLPPDDVFPPDDVLPEECVAFLVYTIFREPYAEAPC